LSRKYYFEFKAFSNKSYFNIGTIKEIKNFDSADESNMESFHKIAKAIKTLLDLDKHEHHIFNKITPELVIIVIDFYIANLVRCGNRELIQ
jgi:hypothetical protein